jgi:mannose-6-phosphate isomerase-like protein (cupin superfamily)
MNDATGSTPAPGSVQVARWADLKPSSKAFLDSHLAAYQKDNFRVIGSGVTEDPGSRPVITGRHGFSVGFARMEPGKGAALHSHRTLEVFIPLNGRMTVTHGAQGEHRIELQPWDTVSVPVGEMRGFSNPNEFPLVMLAIIEDGSNGPERVEWHEDIVRQAQAAGVQRDTHGNLADMQTTER